MIVKMLQYVIFSQILPFKLIRNIFSTKNDNLCKVFFVLVKDLDKATHKINTFVSFM